MKHIDTYKLFESSDSSYHMITIKDLFQEYIDDYDLIRIQFHEHLKDYDLRVMDPGIYYNLRFRLATMYDPGDMKFTSIILSINRTKSHIYEYGLLIDDLIGGFVKRLESLGYSIDIDDARTSWSAIAGDKISTFEIDYSEA